MLFSFAANFAGILLTNVVMQYGYAVFSGGAIHTEAAITIAPCSGVQMINNAATSFGGAFTSFAGSNLARVGRVAAHVSPKLQVVRAG